MSLLRVNFSSRKANNREVWQGMVNIPGLAPTRLARRSDGSTTFATRSAVVNAANILANDLGFDGIEQPSKTPVAC